VPGFPTLRSGASELNSLAFHMRNPWFDSDIAVIGDLVLAIDQKLSEICEKAVANENADEFGYYDAAEHATGLGLVACQTIVATVCGGLGIEKTEALKLGPLHTGGLTKVQIINHAANYWKHNNEWSHEQKDKRREVISRAFDSVGFPVGTDYPLSGVLTELAAPEYASLGAVLTVLAEWRSKVIAALP
jgi:hypothetical protein